MGQKVNPHGLRVGVIKDWDSKWYAEKDFADYLVEDHKIRKFLKNKLYSAGVSKIEIERASDRVKTVSYTHLHRHRQEPADLRTERQILKVHLIRLRQGMIIQQ